MHTDSEDMRELRLRDIASMNEWRNPGVRDVTGSGKERVRAARATRTHHVTHASGRSLSLTPDSGMSFVKPSAAKDLERFVRL